MRQSITLTSFFAGFILAAVMLVLTPLAPAQPDLPRPPATQWEYRTAPSTSLMAPGSSSHPNALGQEGWEMVGSVTMRPHGQSEDDVIVYKRPLR